MTTNTLSRRQRKMLRKDNLLVKENIVNIDKPKKHGITLHSVIPKTVNQELAFEAFHNGQHLLLHGMAGTGKTFISLYLSLTEMFSNYSEYDSVTIIRSAVPTRTTGFLPGKETEKNSIYEQPYKALCSEIFDRGDAYDILKHRGNINFITTSYIRGSTLRDTIIIVDECQNLNYHELDSVITRVGENCRVIFCGDFRQTDFTTDREKKGIVKFTKIIKKICGFEHIEFEENDILRSGIVKDYIIEREKLNFQT
jgi:predicted ribonuclease YlaK